MIFILIILTAILMFLLGFECGCMWLLKKQSDNLENNGNQD